MLLHVQNTSYLKTIGAPKAKKNALDTLKEEPQILHEKKMWQGLFIVQHPRYYEYG